MEYTTLKMRPALRDRLKVIAAKEKVPMVDMVERWITGYEDAERPSKSAEEILKLKNKKEKTVLELMAERDGWKKP